MMTQMTQMRQLFNQQQHEMRRIIKTTIAHHIQLLSIAIPEERVERVQTNAEIHTQICK